MFEEYKDLYELTRKTADDHIEFYKKKESSICKSKTKTQEAQKMKDKS